MQYKEYYFISIVPLVEYLTDSIVPLVEYVKRQKLRRCPSTSREIGARSLFSSTLVNQKQPQSADQNAGELFDADVLPVDQKANHQQR